MIPGEVLSEIRETFEGCQARYPTVRLELEVFMARADEVVLDVLGESGSPDPPGTERWLAAFRGLHHKDLFLATACSRGDRIAWEYFSDDYQPLLKRFAVQACRSLEQGEDLAQDLVTGLLGGSPAGQGSKIAGYNGRGSLAGWLRVSVAHAAIDRFRKAKYEISFEEMQEEGREERLHPVRPDSVEDRLDSRWGHVVIQLLREEIAGLESKDRLLLRLYYLDEVPLKAVGRHFGVHEATASRWLDGVRRKIRKRVEKSLRRQHGMSSRDLKHLWQSVSEGEEFPLEGILADAGDPR